MKEHVFENPGKILNTPIKKALHGFSPKLTSNLNNLDFPDNAKII